jgi:hypothetical protein
MLNKNKSRKMFIMIKIYIDKGFLMVYTYFQVRDINEGAKAKCLS